MSKLLYIVSPAVLWLLFCTVGFTIDKYTFKGDTTEWTHFVAALLIPSLLILAPVIVITRLIANGRPGRVWLVESAIILSFLWLFFQW